MRIVAGKFRPVGAIAATAVTPPSAMSETILAAVTLIVAIGARILLRLRPAPACNERRQAAQILSATFVAALTRLLLIGLLLMLWTVLHLLIARRKWLGIARQIGLALLDLRLRCVARLVLAHERLAVILAVVIIVVGSTLRRSALALLLRLLIVVVGVLLPKLLLRGGDQAKIMFCVLIVVLRRDRVARALRIARKLDVFFCNVRGGTPDLNVGTV